jgi:hypothetical protein
MRRRTWLGLAIAAAAAAQQGHPLTGTWTGDWGPSATERHQVTLVMNWDGKNVTGLMNPGPQEIPLTSVFVDVTDWTVRIEAETKDKMHISAEGKLQDLGSYHRFITGTWKQGAASGDFKITRD